MTDARVRLWGRDIAAVSWDHENNISVFQYQPEFVRSGIEVSPLAMPLAEGTFQFPALAKQTFWGLPGLLADSLPDKFGNALIDAWLASQGRTPDSFNPVERLCYVGTRGIGALEFEPAIFGDSTEKRKLEIDRLVQLANRVLQDRRALEGLLGSGDDDSQVVEDILRVGSSAGGARAKALVAWNESTDEIRSGQVESGDGFSQWLLKFDGVTNNRDKEQLADPQGYGLVEYAYHLMAVDAGIFMSRCRIHREGPRSHFMTRRFDRSDDGKKVHVQSLCAMRHFDFNMAGAYSYEQAMQTMLQLGLGTEELHQFLIRAIFNVMARNQDDHVKNIGFLMDKQGKWSLSPAFDVTYAYNPDGQWTNRHQMSLNGKREDITLEDFVSLGTVANIKKKKAVDAANQVQTAIKRWSRHAKVAGVSNQRISQINKTLITDIV